MVLVLVTVTIVCLAQAISLVFGGPFHPDPDCFPNSTRGMVTEMHSRTEFPIRITDFQDQAFLITGVGFEFELGLGLYASSDCLKSKKSELMYNRDILGSTCTLLLILEAPRRYSYLSPLKKWFSRIANFLSVSQLNVLDGWIREVNAGDILKLHREESLKASFYFNGDKLPSIADEHMSFLLFEEVLKTQQANLVALMYRDNIYQV